MEVNELLKQKQLMEAATQEAIQNLLARDEELDMDYADQKAAVKANLKALGYVRPRAKSDEPRAKRSKKA